MRTQWQERAAARFGVEHCNEFIAQEQQGCHLHSGSVARQHGTEEELVNLTCAFASAEHTSQASLAGFDLTSVGKEVDVCRAQQAMRESISGSVQKARPK